MSRARALKLQYKLNPPAMGVYAIRNLASGRQLLGSSSNLPGALSRHRFELKLGTHRNAALQADWRQFGEAGFSFEIVDTVAPSDAPGFDAGAEIAGLLGLHLELCPPATPGSYR